MVQSTSKTIADATTALDADAPMRPEQARRLQILCAELLQSYDESLTEAQAAARIDELDRLKQDGKDHP